MRRRTLWLFVIGVALLALVGAPKEAVAAAPAPHLMKQLASHARAFEQMKKRASYTISGKLEELAGDDTVSATKSLKAKVVANGTEVRWEVVEYKEDGVDKTQDARREAKERAAENAKKKKRRDFHMPFLSSEQQRYTFEQVEVASTDPNRVKLRFVPKESAEDTIEGSAWVDTKAGTIISAGFKLSETPMFVDYIHITVVFGAATALGPAISKIRVEGKGGILFWNKVFRADAVLSEYAMAP